MDVDLILTLLPFACIASFTPGPNNILVMTQGIRQGLRSTLGYQLGAGLACFAIPMVFFLLGAWLQNLLPSLVSIMKYVGCAYLLWLAWQVATAKPGKASGTRCTASFTTGFVLQFVNPKYYLFVATLTSVLITAAGNIVSMLGYSFIFSVLAVAGMFTWAAAGAVLQNFFLRWHIVVNAVMGLALLWSAWSVFQTQ